MDTLVGIAQDKETFREEVCNSFSLEDTYKKFFRIKAEGYSFKINLGSPLKGEDTIMSYMKYRNDLMKNGTFEARYPKKEEIIKTLPKKQIEKARSDLVEGNINQNNNPSGKIDTEKSKSKNTKINPIDKPVEDRRSKNQPSDRIFTTPAGSGNSSVSKPKPEEMREDEPVITSSSKVKPSVPMQEEEPVITSSSKVKPSVPMKEEEPVIISSSKVNQLQKEEEKEDSKSQAWKKDQQRNISKKADENNNNTDTKIQMSAAVKHGTGPNGEKKYGKQADKSEPSEKKEEPKNMKKLRQAKKIIEFKGENEDDFLEKYEEEQRNKKK